MSNGYVDTFRYLYPNKEFAYTWWSYRGHARENNTGWRIDYFITSDDIKSKIEDSIIHSTVLDSDHCPIQLNINLTF